MHNLQINAGETQQVKFQLSRPVRPWLQVTADGKPLEGGEVSMVEFVDHNESSVYLFKPSAKELGYEFLPSDETGRLMLPALPEGAKVSVWIVHPDRKTAKLEEFVATNKQLASVELDAGVSVTINLTAELAACYRS